MLWQNQSGEIIDIVRLSPLPEAKRADLSQTIADCENLHFRLLSNQFLGHNRTHLAANWLT
jgi:hypothetical protein